MKKRTFLISLIALFGTFCIYAQNDTIVNTQKEIHVLLLDSASKKPLAYANIYLLNSGIGTISNEQGQFSISRNGLDPKDSLRFQYIGYATKEIAINELDTASVVYLTEKISDLNEALVFGNAPRPESIVKQVLIHKDSNYKRRNYLRNKTFIRERENVDFTDVRLDCEKSTVPGLNKEMIQVLEDKIPEHTTSFTDFLGDIYFAKSDKDSIRCKVNEIRIVSLKEKEINDMKQFETIFENAFNDKNEKEYWKVRSGIFSSKIDDDENDGQNSAVKITINDSVKEDSRRKLSSYRNGIKHKLRYSYLNDKDEWEFLHKTGRYKYTLIGGTRVNGEEVYIIDFKPKSGGMYHGRMYIALETFALIRADYEYAAGKTGRNIHLLGIGYTQAEFTGSIYFEKQKEGYVLKYFSYQTSEKVSIERKFALIKKKERLLFDKKLAELKLDVLFALKTEESCEYLVLDDEILNKSQYDAFNQEKYMNVIYVNQYNDSLWNGFSIIEPTKRMKEYKKQQLDFKLQ